MKKFVIICMIAVSCAVYAEKSRDEQASALSGDPRLIIPCFGSDSVLLGDQEGDVIRRHTGQEVSIARTGLKELFADVLYVKTKRKVYFDRILRIGTISFFCLNGRVSAIIGYDDNRFTSENVALDKGADYLIYSYGNKGLSVIKSGANRFIIYEEKGIFIIDDKADDIIDAYAVISCSDQSTPGTR